MSFGPGTGHDTLGSTMMPIEVARALRADRLGKVRSAGLAVPLVEGSKVVLHSIPVRRDPHALNIDVGSANRQALAPLACRSPQRHVYDFDGAFGIQPGPGDSARGYAALFRTGMIEACDTSLVQSAAYLSGGARFIPSAPVAGAIIVATRRFLALQQSLGIAPPIALCVSILDVKGYLLAIENPARTANVHEIMHEELLFPEVIVRDLNEDPMSLLRNTFDQLWNAAGMPVCGDYEDTRGLMIAMSSFE